MLVSSKSNSAGKCGEVSCSALLYISSLICFVFGMVRVSDGCHRINTVIVRQPSTSAPLHSPQRALVLVHGVGGGLGLWIRNYAQLVRSFDTVYAIDLLGFGRSDRPKPPGHDCDAARIWWVNSLEGWRAELGLGKNSRRRMSSVCAVAKTRPSLTL